MSKAAKPDSIYLRVEREALVPADEYAKSQFRAKGYKTGDVIKGRLTKLRSAGFNRLVHRIGQLVVENIEAFSGMEAHKAIKRLQLESGANCDELAILISGYGMVIQRVPLSLSFESIDEAEYHQAAKIICRHIAKVYWAELSAEKIEEMASCFVDE